ncbi:uncharacterized protein LOC116804167 [Drosophila mojavensis]|uniref:uncharacterized protein LOC116804167 n=1 Tax=Drosophila mojavensis TaxID=7230 RepID=UPI001CD04D82|nr:uncharacterized protein LOC116804167 [Drosophila mojavensis]
MLFFAFLFRILTALRLNSTNERSQSSAALRAASSSHQHTKKQLLSSLAQPLEVCPLLSVLFTGYTKAELTVSNNNKQCNAYGARASPTGHGITRRYNYICILMDERIWINLGIMFRNS